MIVFSMYIDTILDVTLNNWVEPIPISNWNYFMLSFTCKFDSYTEVIWKYIYSLLVYY